ncbi:hypothetical protein PIROE2DRAFT_65073 [Piromyces sp. E2]|nr:hypothetical protein PIROE2DRAFT_65073 [Piromyces sp. E2]|eukprot:OUM57324.1 hypothetical protein PIROE2DRAFT_65073 [Piromyces sp. E2]
MQTNNAENTKENQNTQTVHNEEQNGMEFLKTQEEVVVIDVPEQNENAEKEAKEKNKYKHVIIFEQFAIGRVYTTALLAYVMNTIVKILLNIIIGLFDSNGSDKITSTNQKILENGLKNIDGRIIISACIYAPIFEEFIFRSIIFKIINYGGKRVQEKNKFFGITIRALAFIISSFLFAFAHFGYNFKTLRNEFKSFPSYFSTGLFLAYAYNRDNYLLASILAHALNNIIAVILILVTQ